MSVSAHLVKRVKERDNFRCAAEGRGCTRFTELTMQHRVNRGMGGSKLLDLAENLMVLCNTCNGRLERDSPWAEIGRQRGWKLASWEDPVRVAVWFVWAREWRLLLPQAADGSVDWWPAKGRNPQEILAPEVRAVLAGEEWPA